MSTAHLTIVRQIFSQLEVELPSSFAAHVADLEKLREHSRDMLSETVVQNSRRLGTAIADALREDRDPVADQAVRDALIAKQFIEAHPDTALNAYLEQAVTDLFDQEADTLLEALVPTVKAADKALAAARAAIPGLDLRNTGSVASLPPKQLTLWGHARDGLARVERVAKLWQSVAAAAGSTVPPHRKPLMIADLTSEELANLGSRPDAIDAAHAGHALSLATTAEFKERCSRIVDLHAAAADHRAADHRAAVQQRFGFGKVASA